MPQNNKWFIVKAFFLTIGIIAAVAAILFTIAYFITVTEFAKATY
jgi:hypothetical protein